LHGFAGKDCELFWGTEVLKSMKSQTPSTKLQTNLKFQYQMTKTGLEFLVALKYLLPTYGRPIFICIGPEEILA
jgi:hypothetical protein